MTDSVLQTNSLRPIQLVPLPDCPLVSILMSNRNYSVYLSEAIESCLEQSYGRFELIISDDGSTDTSCQILKKYQALDRRIKVIYQTHGGQSLALNEAFRESVGEIICLLDADDIFLPDKIRRVINAFAVVTDSGFAVNRMFFVDRVRRRLGELPLLHRLPSGWQGPSLCLGAPQVLPGLPPCSGLSLRRSVAAAIFPLPSALKAYSDWLIQVLAPLVTLIAPIEYPLSEYRVHGANVGGVGRFTEDRLRNIVYYEKYIWGAWRRYLASPFSGLPSDFPLPSEMTPSLMDYAYARFRSDRNFKTAYHAIHPSYFQVLPRPHQWYWRASSLMPNWLFRRSFAFVYGQTPAKIVLGRILRGYRKALGCQQVQRMATQAQATQTVESHTCFRVLGVRVDAVRIPDVVERMQAWIRNRDGCHSIAATGMHGVVKAQHDPAFRDLLNSTDLVVPDGMPLVWFGRRHGHHLPRRVYGPDLLLAFCEKSASQGYRHFFYGGEPGVAEQLAESLKVRFPGLNVVGTYSPPFRPLSAKEDEAMVEMMGRVAPDVLWVGLGAPKQERWMHEHKDRLRVPVIVGVGAAFDMLSGRRKQAPRWMREHGLEWSFRLLQEPRRLWRRYLVYGTQNRMSGKQVRT